MSGFLLTEYFSYVPETLGNVFFWYGIAMIPLLYLITHFSRSREYLYSIMAYLFVAGCKFECNLKIVSAFNRFFSFSDLFNIVFTIKYIFRIGENQSNIVLCSGH